MCVVGTGCEGETVESRTRVTGQSTGRSGKLTLGPLTTD